MKIIGASFAAGATFALGLGVSGMTKPAKVLGFLDLFGAWDASLAFVMVGAIAVHFVAYRLIMRRRSPLFDTRFHLPTRKHVDARLILGAALFGVGWALGGYCPGPGLVAAASGATSAVVFVVGMLVGGLIESAISRASVDDEVARSSQLDGRDPPGNGRECDESS
ncbi:MAG TPA: YeeE/YedE family protein [Labilithrix sp.]|jgi:uncharacterized membrane protein YedE/YeeE|nr:YeeE/YedE family protein [Labilithrix sp.]